MQDNASVSLQVPASTTIRQQPPAKFTSAAEYLPAVAKYYEKHYK